jgi:hypothetical protein
MFNALFPEIFVEYVSGLQEYDFSFCARGVGIVVTESEMAGSPSWKSTQHDRDLSSYFLLMVRAD